jgi:glycine/serine hydroxymethyltransferase
MKEPEMQRIAGWIARALAGRNDPAVLAKVRAEVLELAEAFPLYGFLRG